MGVKATDIKERTQLFEGLWEQTAQKQVWTNDEGNDKSMWRGDPTNRGFVMFNFRQKYSYGDQIDVD